LPCYYKKIVVLRTLIPGCKISPKFKNSRKKRMKKEKKPIKPRELSKADQDMIDELDYEYKKAHKPYDKWERHWDEA